jgi:hypothetical protein
VALEALSRRPALAVLGCTAAAWRHAALLNDSGVIGISRLAPAHALTGGSNDRPSVGLAGAWTLLLLAGRAPPDLDGQRIAGVVVVLFHGLHLPTEAHIRGSTWQLA